MKHLSTFKQLFLSIVLFAIIGNAYCQIPNPGPVAWWSMAHSESSDTILAENIAGHHGILRNFPKGYSNFVPGKVGEALNFTGDSSLVYIPDSINWMSTGKFTFCYWMYIDTAAWDNPEMYGFNTGALGDPGSFTIRIGVRDKWFRIYSYDKAGTERRIERKVRADYAFMFDKAWMHLAVVSSAESFTLYVNGVYTATVPVAHIGTDSVYSSIIGCGFNSKRFFKGKLDEVRLYDYDLSSSQITALMEITTHAQLQAKEFKLANYPNPMSDETTISYTLQKPGKVTLDILDINGQLIKTLVNNEYRQLNAYQDRWDCRGENGQFLSTGIYFYRLSVDNKTVGIGKMSLLSGK